MDLNNFIALRPFLYHLTDRHNINTILNEKKILSTKKIVEDSDIENKRFFLRTRRPEHTIVNANNREYKIRDQRPISIKALSKCTTHGWQASDFIEHINSRVFFWCTKARLTTHFQRYKHERPIIIRCQTASIVESNYDSVRLCRLNSGATRANSYLGGIAPPRGPNTFKSLNNYDLTPGTVVEFTVLEECTLAGDITISDDPNGPWS